MLFDRVSPAAEGVSVDLSERKRLVDENFVSRFYFVFDLFRRVGEKDRRVQVGRGHFRFGALEGRKECRVNQRGFGEIQPGRDVTRHAEIRILIDGTRNQTV